MKGAGLPLASPGKFKPFSKEEESNDMFTRRMFLTLATLVCASVAFAQSSGNFSATGYEPTCMISQSDGTFSGGTCTVGAPGTSSQCGMMSAPISVSGGSGNTLLIRPSLVTGLYTNTNLLSSNQKSSGITVATADVGIQVCVTVDGSSTGVKPAGCVTYDERFQQLSSNLFSVISACATPTNPGGTTNCSIDLIESTLAAHSFDFVIPQTALADGKSHTVAATWTVANGKATSTGGSVLACAGPGVTTVTQTKVFNNSGSLTF